MDNNKKKDLKSTRRYVKYKVININNIIRIPVI